MTPAGRRAVRPWDRWPVAGVIADLDGVLIDSTEAARAQWRWWAGRVGAHAPEVAAFAAGRRPAEVVDRFAPTHDASTELAAIAHRAELLRRACRRHAGARAFVRGLPADRFAVVTGLDREAARAQLRRARLPPPAVLVTGDELVAGRPDPSGHEQAARQLGVDPADVIAIEASAVGSTAAHELGMTVLSVGGDAPATGTGAIWIGDLRHLRVVVEPDRLTLRATREPARWP